MFTLRRLCFRFPRKRNVHDGPLCSQQCCVTNFGPSRGTYIRQYTNVNVHIYMDTDVHLLGTYMCIYMYIQMCRQGEREKES